MSKSKQKVTVVRPLTWRTIAVLAVLCFPLGVGIGWLVKSHSISTTADAAIQEVTSPARPPVPMSLSGAYLAARHARQQEAFDVSALYLRSAHRFDADNQALENDAVRELIINGDIQEALELIEADQGTEKKKADNSLYDLMLAMADIRRHAYADASQRLEPFAKQGTLGAIYAVLQSWLDAGQDKAIDAKALNKYAQTVPFFAPMIHFHLALMHQLDEDAAKATQQFAKATQRIETLPSRIAVAALRHYRATEDTQRYDALYQAYLAAHPDNELFQKMVQETTPIVSSADQGVAEVMLNLASAMMGDASGRDALLYLQMAKYVRPYFPVASYMKGSLLEDAGQYKAAIDVFRTITAQSAFHRDALIHIALNQEALEQDRAAFDTLHAAITAYPDDPKPLRALADFQRSHKKYAYAIDSYAQAIERYKVKEVPWELYYVRGIAYERDKKWELAEQDFLRALELEPNQPDVQNYLAYSWLEQGAHLQKSKHFLQSAIKANPGAPHIVDSMGWAHYKLGEYAKAVEYLEKAVDALPHDPVVNDHLGDAYWQVGRVREAKYQWERALIFEPEEELERMISLKLEYGYEDAQQLAEKTPSQKDDAGPTLIVWFHKLFESSAN